MPSNKRWRLSVYLKSQLSGVSSDEKIFADGDILSETMPQAMTGIANNIICCVAFVYRAGDCRAYIEKAFY